MTITEARAYLVDWMSGEYESDYTDADLGEDNTRIAVAYTDYEGQGDGLFVTEQWYVDLVNKTLFCELNEERIPELDSEYEYIEYGFDYDCLIGESDEYIREHREHFKKGA